MKVAAYVVIFYALFIFVGGVIGYFQAHSIASLIMASTFCLGLMISGIGILKNCSKALILGIVLSLLLAVFFGYRFSIAFKWMPAGMLCIASLISALSIFAAISAKKKGVH